MSNHLPPGEHIRKAAAFIAQIRKEDKARSLASILDEAGMRFNLTPLDSEALQRLFADSPQGDDA